MKEKETIRRSVAEAALLLTMVEVSAGVLIVPEWKLFGTLIAIPFIVYGLFLILWKLE